MLGGEQQVLGTLCFSFHNLPSYEFWKEAGGLVTTGHTGTNVMDLQASDSLKIILYKKNSGFKISFSGLAPPTTPIIKWETGQQNKQLDPTWSLVC